MTRAKKPVSTDGLPKGVPVSLRIGATLYSIRALPKTQRKDLFGLCEYDTRIIWLDPTMAPAQMANTFIHETLHAIHHAYGLDPDGDVDEESYACLTANGLCAFWTDNPDVIEWWQGLLKQVKA